MDFKNIPKGLFSLKKEVAIEKPQEINLEPIQIIGNNINSLLHNDNVTVERFGFNSAKSNNASTIGLSICLNRIYLDHKDKITKDVVLQENLKKPYKLKLVDLISENEGFEKRKEKIKNEEIQGVSTKIERLHREILDIRTNPERLTGDKSGNASFYIGLIILAFLTIYLFIFYSSASYSSFFKEFSISELGLASSIFDPQALSKAFIEGATELILIVTIPAVFLGLGYLIHKFQAQKGSKKYFIISFLILVTFIFDLIIAYEICEKIYNIKKENGFQNIPDYSLSLAFQSINFWLIIFAGFIVYLIWGFVFDFTMESYEKLDRVRLAIKSKEQEIKTNEDIIDKMKLDINRLEEIENNNKGEINKLKETIDHTTIIPPEFEQYLFHFMQGWLQWMSANLKNQTQQLECEDVLNKFISTNIKSI